MKCFVISLGENGFGIRHLQCTLIFFALAVSYSLRVNMSVAIVAMTDKKADSDFGVDYDDHNMVVTCTKNQSLSKRSMRRLVEERLPKSEDTKRVGGKCLFLIKSNFLFLILRLIMKCFVFSLGENGFGIRHLQCTLIFFALAVSYSLRVNMSVAIVAMTDKKADSDFGVYPWTEKTKSIVLSSFFWGYVITQIPAGQLAQKYGGQKVLFWGIFICSVVSILTPVCAKIGGWPFVCSLRLIQGLCQGSVFPSTHNLISKWAPVKERGMLGTICYSGSQLGTALMLCVSGEVASSAMGWPGIFYTSGGVGCIWAVLWHFFAASSPDESRFISNEEKMYIQMSPVPTIESPKEATEEPKPQLKTPWMHILSSVPFYCVMVAHCTNTWGYYTLLTQIPTYLKSILGMDIKKNALLSSLPYWVMLILSYFFLFISEILNRKQCMSLSFSRKFFNTIGHWIPMLSLIGMGFMNGDNETLVITLLVLTVGVNAACYLGFQLNHIDLSTNFAGTLMGLTNCAANIMSISAPLAVGLIVTDEKNPEQWKIIFFITAGFFFIGNLLFILFGKFETQFWDEPTKTLIAESKKHKSQNSVYMETVH